MNGTRSVQTLTKRNTFLNIGMYQPGMAITCHGGTEFKRKAGRRRRQQLVRSDTDCKAHENYVVVFHLVKWKIESATVFSIP